MAEAGFEDGLTIPTSVGTIPLMVSTAELVQAQLAEVGITLELHPIEAAQVGTSFQVEKENDMLMGYWGGRPSPFQTLFLLYSEFGLNNPGQYRSEAFEEAYAEAVNATTDEERTAALQRGSRVVTEEALDAPLMFNALPNAWRTNIVGVESYLSGKQEFRGVGVLAD